MTAPSGGGPAGLRGTDRPLAEVYDVALVDLDGVVYLGGVVIPGAAEALRAARAAGLRVAFVTNNASRPAEAVAAHLRELGVDASPRDVVTSAQAAAGLVADRFEAGTRVLPVGGEGVSEALVARGFRLVAGADDDPAVVVQGFGPDLRYSDLAEAALAVRRGAWWVATNRDATLPTTRGIQPGNGALVGAVEVAVGHPPDAFAGKPDPALLGEAIRRTGARRPLMVGDRLDTDIEGARVVGIDSLCVLSGVSLGGDLVQAAPELRPSYVGLDLRALMEVHPSPAVTDDGARCGVFRAVRADDGIRADAEAGRRAGAADAARAVAAVDADVAGRGPGSDGADPAGPAHSRDGADGADPVDLLRAVAAAAWAGSPPDGTGRLHIPAALRPVATQARLDRLLADAPVTVR